MDSYETQLVQDIMAAGDLPAIEKLFHSLLTELKSKLPSIRNPRRTAWVHCWTEGLKRIGDLPEAPPAFAKTRIDPQEVDLCARRVVESGELDKFLWNVACELNSIAANESDPERKLWMAHAGEILTQTVTASPPTDIEKEVNRELIIGPADAYRVREHRLLGLVSAVLLLLICLGTFGYVFGGLT